MDLYRRVRLACHSQGMSSRKAARQFGISRETVAKMLKFSEPPGYRRTAATKRPKLDGFTPIIDGYIDGDKSVPRKQRHTAKRIFERLRDEHDFTGGYTIIKDYVRTHHQRHKEVFVPLSHAPGHGQADFGEAQVIIGGVQQTKKCAERMAFDLEYDSQLNIKTYERLIEFTAIVSEGTKAMMPVDNIDIQSFFYVVGNAGYVRDAIALKTKFEERIGGK